jgi:secreted PhoX family phosphatase
MLGVTAWVTSACIPPDQSGPSAGLVLLPGFTARVIARGGQVVPNTSLLYRWAADGAATFEDPSVPGGWFLTVNHETPSDGGVTSIRFAPDGTVTGAQAVLSGTSTNCAGGATPWGTWLSCEEFDLGRVWECDPTGATPAQVRPALGAFAHEAAAVAADGRVYLTEDRSDGGFYRFTPTTPGDLSSGLLEVATGTAPGTLGWVPVPDPSAASTLCRYQVPASTKFNGGEGIDTLGNDVWFTTKGDKRVWHYDTATAAVSIRYQAGSGTLDAVDNLWVDDASSNLFVAEDGGNMELVMLRPDNTTVAVARVPGEAWSEITGPCFSPDGQRLYFSSQRAATTSGLSGVTYEVSGPFDTLLNRP